MADGGDGRGWIATAECGKWWRSTVMDSGNWRRQPVAVGGRWQGTVTVAVAGDERW